MSRFYDEMEAADRARYPMQNVRAEKYQSNAELSGFKKGRSRHETSERHGSCSTEQGESPGGLCPTTPLKQVDADQSALDHFRWRTPIVCDWEADKASQDAAKRIVGKQKQSESKRHREKDEVDLSGLTSVEERINREAASILYAAAAARVESC